MVQHYFTHGIHDSQYSDADGGVSLAERENQQRFDYIENLMNQARKGRVIERTERVEIKNPEAPDLTLWRAKAIVDLYEWMKASDDYNKTIQIWAAIYIQCGTCARGFSAWYEECEVGPEDDLPGWLEAAQKIVTEKHWI
jgi:hypothetical protein